MAEKGKGAERAHKRERQRNKRAEFPPPCPPAMVLTRPTESSTGVVTKKKSGQILPFHMSCCSMQSHPSSLDVPGV